MSVALIYYFIKQIGNQEQEFITKYRREMQFNRLYSMHELVMMPIHVYKLNGLYEELIKSTQDPLCSLPAY